MFRLLWFFKGMTIATEYELYYEIVLVLGAGWLNGVSTVGLLV